MKPRKLLAVLFLLAASMNLCMALPGAALEVWGESLPQDGVYTPACFTWSGGTGRVEITCPRVEIREGQAYATVVFDSDAYGYVKLEGEKYLPDHSGGVSSFEIPVTLGENISILGMTTKMSSAHEIQYTLYFSLTQEEGAGLAGDGRLDETPPAIPGYSFVEEEVFSQTGGAKLFHYDGGLSLLEVSQWEGEAAGKDSLYDSPVVKYLLVPGGTELPSGLEKEAVVVETPVESVFAAHGDGAALLEEMGLAGVISSAGFSEEECEGSQVGRLLQEGEILAAGSWEEPEYKTILKASCRLALLPAQLLEEEKREEFLDICQHFSLLGIPVLVDLPKEDLQGQEDRRLIFERIFTGRTD
ncbi:MAG: hypothetical protein Q4D55_03805 [Eubacteriales bacterium]|nr:hypothetical protein [Eubacteriales bacterium]